MQIVIDIPEEVYNNMVVKNEYTDMDVIAVHNALMGAIRIPKGHGRLIDAEALQKQAVKVKLEHVAREIEVVTKNQIKEAAAIPIIEGDRKCNQCAFYKGVHNVQGHAPCSKLRIPGVLWNDTCDQFREAAEGLE